MNLRKIQLALTTGLINKNTGDNALGAIKELMGNFSDDAGRFLGLIRLGGTPLNQQSIQERYALQYERCTVDVDLVYQPSTQKQIVQRFNLR